MGANCTNHEREKNVVTTRLWISSVLMTIALLAVVPFSLRLAGTWRLRVFRVADNQYVENYWLPMGLASLTLICIGLFVVWSHFRRGQRSAWLILFLIASLFYFPVLIFPQFPINWTARIQNAFTEKDRLQEWTFHLLGFFLMLIALLLPLKDIFWRSKPSPASSEMPGLSK